MRPDIRESLIAYARAGRPLGHFLTAVVENNLMEAIKRADSDNVRDLHQIVSFVYNDLPSISHGSPEKVERYYGWIAVAENRAAVERHFGPKWRRGICDRCGGLGRIEDTECDDCGGTGRPPTPPPDTLEEARGDK